MQSDVGVGVCCTDEQDEQSKALTRDGRTGEMAREEENKKSINKASKIIRFNHKRASGEEGGE